MLYTSFAGIPYPASTEKVDDAAHWDAAMKAVDAALIKAQADINASTVDPLALRDQVAATLRPDIEALVQAGLADSDAIAQAATAAVDAAVSGQEFLTVDSLGPELAKAQRFPDRMAAGSVYGVQTGFDTHEQTMLTPYLYDDRTIVSDEAGRIVDGCQFFAMLRVGDKPGQWIDEYYGYVSGHGGYGSAIEKGYIWLVTAPSPYGPWTWHPTPIVGTGDSPYLQSKVVGPRTIAPDVMWVGNEIWLTYHGLKLQMPWHEGYDYLKVRNAPSVLAKSTDGVHFTEHGIVIDVEEDTTRGSAYASSTSYRRTVLDNGVWRAIWQANSTASNDSVGLANYSAGYAVSSDGVDWVKQRPLVLAEPGDQGIFAPGFVKVPQGWLMLCQYRAGSGGADAQARWYFSKTLEPGSFRFLGRAVLEPRGGRTGTAMFMPFFFVHDGILHVAYGGRVDPAKPPVISVAKVGWR